MKKQRKIIQLFNHLMASGFTLTEMVNFLRRSQLLPLQQTEQMRQCLLDGKGMSAMLSDLGFSDNVMTQLDLAEVHGNTHRSMVTIEAYLHHLLQVKKRLLEVITYPMMLLGFLVLIMLGLKNYLLPQLEEGNVATTLINHFPMIFLVGVNAVLLLIALVILLCRNKSRLRLFSFWAKTPIVGKFVTNYLTAYYAREWGNLLEQGLELAQIVSLMQTQKSQLFREIGRDLQEGLLSGKEFHQKVLDYPFFHKELSLIIEYGEVKSKLGRELSIYANETWELFFSRLNKAMQLIQPLIFIFVAIMIVMIYAAMLLPMYENMGGYF